MPHYKSILLALGALGLAGCASDTASIRPAAAVAPAAVPAVPRIVLAPSDEAYQEALKGLSPQERALFKKGMGFTVDTLVVKPTPIEGMPWSRKRPDTPLQVSIPEFVRFIDRQPALRGPVRVNLSTARVLAGLTFNQEASQPVYRIQMEVVVSGGSYVSVTGFGAGPTCLRHGDGSAPTLPEIAKSAQVAFMKAFLKTLLKINDQVLQS